MVAENNEPTQKGHGQITSSPKLYNWDFAKAIGPVSSVYRGKDSENVIQMQFSDMKNEWYKLRTAWGQRMKGAMTWAKELAEP